MRKKLTVQPNPVERRFNQEELKQLVTEVYHEVIGQRNDIQTSKLVGNRLSDAAAQHFAHDEEKDEEILRQHTKLEVKIDKMAVKMDEICSSMARVANKLSTHMTVSVEQEKTFALSYFNGYGPQQVQEILHYAKDEMEKHRRETDNREKSIWDIKSKIIFGLGTMLLTLVLGSTGLYLNNAIRTNNQAVEDVNPNSTKNAATIEDIRKLLESKK